MVVLENSSLDEEDVEKVGWEDPYIMLARIVVVSAGL